MAEITINLTPAEYDRTLTFLASIQGIEGHLSTLLANQDRLFQIGEKINVDITQLESTVTKTEGVEASAVVTLKAISAEIAASKADPVKLQALADRLNTSADALAAAIAENPGTPTPA